MVAGRDHMVEQLLGKYPKAYGKLRFGLEVSHGWYDILNKLGSDIEPLCNDDLYCVQVKEKFGGLRVYMTGCDILIEAHIRKAEGLALETCESCGAPGSLRGGSWLLTLCDDCALTREGTSK